MIKKFFIQDAAQFYLFDSVADANSPSIHDRPEEIINYPGRITDHDTAGAQRAREWAIERCAAHGIELEMVPL